MKLMIASDIHGDALATSAMLGLFRESRADRLLLLGDILYHGPRNDLPDGYAPKKVIEFLNAQKDKILCVRGNCDTEVDGMVLAFPVLAEYAFIGIDGVCMLATHGHRYNLFSPPPLAHGSVLLCGHTHVPKAERFGAETANVYINPGSVSLPKENSPASYIIYDNGIFSFRSLADGAEYMSYKL